MTPRIALAGNPNAGKTSLFNALTGTVQQVSNYPGVTVEYKAGTATLGERAFTVIDLPGTYSLAAYSQEEVVARNVIIEEKPDLVVDVVDASNLERNLYLAVQLMEMRVPLVIALNMVDVAENRGYIVDVDRLSSMLGVPVVPTVASRGQGVQELLAACVEAMEGRRPCLPKTVTYGHEVDEAIDGLAEAVQAIAPLAKQYAPRWVAVKLLEGDPEVLSRTRVVAGGEAEALVSKAASAAAQIQRHFKDDAATIIAERRYGFAAGAVKESVQLTGEARQNLTDQIDAIVCNRALGPVILFALVAFMFLSIFKLSDEWAWIPWFGGWRSPTGLMVWVFDQLAAAVAPLAERAPMLHSVLADALIGGVGGVMAFVPLIFIMFLFVSTLEDTGYIARVAFILDRLLQTFGLQGKSILPMIVSGGLGTGGCAVPGVMATRVLREEKDRLITMLVAPFMNCGAKMPVYAMLIAAFFPEGRTRMMLLLWALSWVVALCAAWCLRRFLIHGEQSPFVMELPPYHVPVLRGVLQHTWGRTWMYIRKAGTIILAINIVFWALMYFPRHPSDAPEDAERLSYSVAGRIGRSIEPVSRLAGFDWRTNVALIGGFAAKEVVVGTLGTMYAMDTEEDADSLPERLSGDPAWNRLRAFTLMIFVMIYAPCFVCMSVIRRESGSWKWALFSTGYSTLLAFVLATLVYQGGCLFGLAPRLF